jgi:hypothetical protein
VAPAPAAPADGPDGLISGSPHVVRFRPELLTLAREPAKLTRRERTAGAAAVASCDAAQVEAADKVPTTSRAEDAAAACVVLPVGSRAASAGRVLLGAAQLVGEAIQEVDVRTHKKRDEIVVRLTTSVSKLVVPPDVQESGTAFFTPPAWRVDVDGVVVGRVVDGRSPGFAPTIGAQLVISGPAIRDQAARELAEHIDQARSEQLIGLVDQATMTRHARELVAAAGGRVEDKSQFGIDCRAPEAPGTLVLGCYDGRIFVLRVDRPDLAPVMIVTAAHEMLHAAWSAMTKAQQRLIVRQLDDFMGTTGDARIEELLTEYEAVQPGSRDTELHSLLGTQVRDLPAPIERYYRRYFTDRSVIVDAFDAYAHVFDDLKGRYDQLDAEAQSLAGELAGLQAEIEAAGQEADRLTNEIDALRDQGRIDESNQLVGSQNAAVGRANELANTYNARVDDYNAKIAELNELAITLENTYNEISPVPAGG